MKLDDRYSVGIYIASLIHPEIMYDDYSAYTEDRGDEPFIVYFYVYDNETQMATVECDTADGRYETVHGVIEFWKDHIKHEQI